MLALYWRGKDLEDFLLRSGTSQGYPMALIYTSNLMAEKEHVSTVSFKTLEKNLKYLGIDLTKDMEDLYDENYTTSTVYSTWMGFNGLSCCLLCWHSMWITAWVLAAPFPIHFLAKAPGKAVEDGLSPWASASTWETQIKLLDFGFSLAQPDLCGHLGIKLVSRRSFFLYLSLSFCISDL